MEKHELKALLQKQMRRSNNSFVRFLYKGESEEAFHEGYLEDVLEQVPGTVPEHIYIFGLYSDGSRYSTSLVLHPLGDGCARPATWTHAVKLPHTVLADIASGTRRHLVWPMPNGHEDNVEAGDNLLIHTEEGHQKLTAAVVSVSSVPSNWCRIPLLVCTVANVVEDTGL